MSFLETVGLLDAIFIGILVISIIVGLIRGGVREVLSLVGLALAIYCAFTFSEMLSDQYLSQFFEQPRISYIISFALIIIGVLFAVALVNLLISQLLRASGLSFINRFLGMLFGIARGGIICCLLVLVLGFIPGVNDKAWWRTSTMVPIFKVITTELLNYLPQNIADYFESSKAEAEKLADKVLDEQAAQDESNAPADPLAEKMQEIQNQSQNGGNVDSQVQQAILESIAEDAPSDIQLESTNDNSSGQNDVSANDAAPNRPASTNSQETDKSELILESYSQ